MEDKPRTEYVPIPRWAWTLVVTWGLLSLIHNFILSKSGAFIEFAFPIGMLGVALLLLTYGHYRIFAASPRVRMIAITLLMISCVLYMVAFT